MSSEVPRHLQPLISEALTDTRVVGIIGPRQAGKSTLANHLVAVSEAAAYVTLDDLAVRTTAAADPQGFVVGRPGLLVIDEVQRVPDLLLAIKAEVDRDQRPGRFLITGSTQLSATRGVADSLAGRIERFELWPFSQSELAGTPRTLIDRLLDGDIPREYHSSTTKLDYLELAIAGGFPEALRRIGRRRSAWFDAYVETVIEREVPGVSASPRTADLPRLLRLIAARHAAILNVAELARTARLPEAARTATWIRWKRSSWFDASHHGPPISANEKSAHPRSTSPIRGSQAISATRISPPWPDRNSRLEPKALSSKVSYSPRSSGSLAGPRTATG